MAFRQLEDESMQDYMPGIEEPGGNIISTPTSAITQQLIDYPPITPTNQTPVSLPYGKKPVAPQSSAFDDWWNRPSTVANRFGASPTQPAKFGSQPFFIPSNRGTGGKIPGQTYGASGPTGQFMTPPTMGPMPEFKLPIWDESAIESKAQKAAGPGVRELRKGMREAQGRYYENPNVRRMTLRDAMAGYGMGLEKVLGGARQQATAEYAAEYAPQTAKAQAEYQTGVNQTLNQYQNAWREYLYRMQNSGA